LEQELAYADIVISCTAASHPVLRIQNCGDVLKARAGHKILFIDIAVPRDVEPELACIEGVYIYDIDKLQDTLDASYQERKKAAGLAKTIIQNELLAFNQWLATLYVVPVVAALKGFGEEVKQRELKRAFNRLGKISEREQKVIIEMSNAIVNQLIRLPVENLKEMAVSNQGHLYTEITKKLFDLQIDHEEQELYESFEVGYKGQ
jgi:glutamyl-tRNA reductase